MTSPAWTRRLGWPRLAAYGCLLLFWSVALWKLDQYPPVNDDEPCILLPGYSLFTHGVFGSPVFAGFSGMDRLYFQAPPLMSVLQGGAAVVLGLGIWQMRYLPVVLGTLTIALCFNLGRRWLGAPVGALAAALLVFWRWTPAGAEGQGSGVVLVDIARIARYDILTAPLGLAALTLFLAGGRRGQTAQARRRSDFLAGLLVGLAGLAHYYGLFWAGIFGVLLLASGVVRSERPRALLGRGLWLAGGLALVWLPWLLLVVMNWPLFQGQNLIYRGHFALLHPGFYLRSVQLEGQRYFPGGLAGPAAWSLAGAWLLLLGVPVAAVWLARQSLRRRDDRLAWLWAPAMLFPILFALLVQQKAYGYLASFVAILALLVAYAGWKLLAARGDVGRALGGLGLALIVWQGSLGTVGMLRNAAKLDAPGPFLARLPLAAPEAGLILGPVKYAFPFIGVRDFRTIQLIYLLGLVHAKQSSAPDSFDEGLNLLKPRYILLDEVMWHSLTETDLPGSAARNATFWTYLRQHGGELQTELRDNYGQTVRVYRLDP